LVGEIIRKGTNYLICVTEDGIMFKSWLSDVREVHEIGTTEYLNYVQSITPGERVQNFSDVIVKNTYLKKKDKTINNIRKK